MVNIGLAHYNTLEEIAQTGGGAAQDREIEQGWSAVIPGPRQLHLVASRFLH